MTSLLEVEKQLTLQNDSVDRIINHPLLYQRHRRLEDWGLTKNEASSTKNLVYRSLPIFTLTAAAFLFVLVRKYCWKLSADDYTNNNDGNTVSPEEVEKDDDFDDVEMTEGSATSSSAQANQDG